MKFSYGELIALPRENISLARQRFNSSLSVMSYCTARAKLSDGIRVTIGRLNARSPAACTGMRRTTPYVAGILWAKNPQAAEKFGTTNAIII
jgi:hypothetical protein